MVTLFEEYGKTLLSVIAVCLLVIFLFGASDDGFLYQMEDRAEEIESPYTESWKAEEVGEIVSRKEPVIHLREQSAGGADIYQPGKEYDLAELIWAQDDSGQELEVRIADVREKETGESIFWNTDGTLRQNADSFRFPEKGIYEVDILAVDSKNIVTGKTIDIPVRRK